MGKLFNHNNLKMSYSFVPNIKSKVSAHNRRLLQVDKRKEPRRCNCRDKDRCPFKGTKPCDLGAVVYKAKVIIENQEDKFYIGSTNNFKHRVCS